MLHGLGSLVHTVIGSFPVKDPHSKERQESWIIDLGLVHLLEPLCPLNHMGPESIIKKEVGICIPPPPVMDSDLVLSRFPNPVEGILGDL